MATEAKEGKGGAGELFARRASGLTRTVSPWSALVYAFVCPTMTFAFLYYYQEQTAYVGALGWVTSFAVLALMPIALIYVFMSLSMPRSGGEYIYVSRILNPLLGFIACWTLTIVGINWSGLLSQWAVNWGLGNLFLAAFFTFHYGIFCLVHGGLIVAMFGRDGPGPHRLPPLPELPQLAFEFALRNGLLWAAIALVASHGVSFYTHYLKPRAFDDANAGKAMFEPYKRVVILHVVLLAGAFAADAFGASVAPLLLLIGLKIAVDLASHRREHAVPYEREMRDFIAEHGHRFVHADVPAAAPAARRR